MLDLREVAVLEEARLSLGMSEVAIESRRIPEEWGGGVVTRGDPGTWVNTSVGLGMHGAVRAEAVDAVIEFHESAGVEPRVEVCPFADASIVGHLATRGLALNQFENVFFRPVEAGEPVTARAPEGVRIEAVDPDDEMIVGAYCRAVASGFAEPAMPSEADLGLALRVVRHPRVVSFAAIDGAGRIVGGGSVERHGDLASLFALSVAPAFRRRGIQRALMAARLTFSGERGVRVATISSKPGVATERNARRMGFQVAYTRSVLTRPGPGLIANTS